VILYIVGACSQSSDKVLYSDPTVEYKGFVLKYNEQHEQADWVAYELTAEETSGSYERTNNFRADPNITTGSASLEDYKYSGYDRGHLIPAGDVQWSKEAMSSSFYFSNISPQDPGFNRGDWRLLEEKVRAWAKANKSVHVVTGPALKQGVVDTIGQNKVTVPRYYYKVILDDQEPELKGIGFIMPNKTLLGSIQDYAVTIDSVEVFTGIDFYSSLSDRIEDTLEANINIDAWNFGSSSEYRNGEAVRCLAITEDNSRCERKTTNESGYCWQHE
jgi:endonuclease G